MIIHNDASYLSFYAYLVGRPPDSFRETEVASLLKFNITYIAFAILLGEKLIYI